MTRQKTKPTSLQARELYRTADQLAGTSRAFLAGLLSKTKKYERDARQQGDVAAADLYQANAETVRSLLDDATGGGS